MEPFRITRDLSGTYRWQRFSRPVIVQYHCYLSVAKAQVFVLGRYNCDRSLRTGYTDGRTSGTCTVLLTRDYSRIFVLLADDGSMRQT